MSQIFGTSIQLMNKSMDNLWMKMSTNLDNIANVDTVGYKAKYVTFEEAFKDSLDKATATNNTDNIKNAIANSQPLMHTSTTEGLRLDGNNVNLDVEMIEMTRTSLQYQYALSSINSDIARLRTAIKGQ